MIAVLVVTPAALPVARRIKDALPGARLHGLAGRIDEADELFSDTKTHIAALFQAGTGIIGVCAAGILIRAIGPVLVDKQAEPHKLTHPGEWLWRR